MPKKLSSIRLHNHFVTAVLAICVGSLAASLLTAPTIAKMPPLQVEPAPEANELQSEWENARAHHQSGDQHRVSGDLSLALEDYRAAASIMERLVAARPDNAIGNATSR